MTVYKKVRLMLENTDSIMRWAITGICHCMKSKDDLV